MFNSHSVDRSEIVNLFSRFVLSKENIQIINDVVPTNNDSSSSDFSKYHENKTYDPPLVYNERVEMKEIFKNTNTAVENKGKKRYIPDQEDSLFWCLFIHKYGYTNYLDIKCKYKNRELEEKTEIVKYVESNLNCMKHMKISKACCQEIMGHLLTSCKTNLLSLHALCLYYDMHVVIVNERSKTYYEYGDINEKLHTIYKSDSLMKDDKFSKYSITLNEDDRIMDEYNIENNYIKYETYNKCLKAISTYKVIDLENIAKKIGISCDCKKNELYTSIYAKLI